MYGVWEKQEEGGARAGGGGGGHHVTNIFQVLLQRCIRKLMTGPVNNAGLAVPQMSVPLLLSHAIQSRLCPEALRAQLLQPVSCQVLQPTAARLTEGGPDQPGSRQAESVELDAPDYAGSLHMRSQRQLKACSLVLVPGWLLVFEGQTLAVASQASGVHSSLSKL